MASNKRKKEMDEGEGSNKKLLLMSSEQNDSQPSTLGAGMGNGDTQVGIASTGDDIKKSNWYFTSRAKSDQVFWVL